MGTCEGLSRRQFVTGAALTGGAVALGGELSPAAAAGGDFGSLPTLSGRTFDLDVSQRIVNKTGSDNLGNTINGTVPGPILRWREGDVVELNVTNNLPELTGLHWHGIILPNGMDGVPGLEFAGIQPGETFTYRFPVLQSGTYWYHSHMGYQEQKGLYGALIIEPNGKSLIHADRDYVVVLSDWTDEDPKVIASNFKQMYRYTASALTSTRVFGGENAVAFSISSAIRWITSFTALPSTESGGSLTTSKAVRTAFQRVITTFDSSRPRWGCFSKS